MERTLWRPRKTHFSYRNSNKHEGKQQFRTMTFTGAVRKGGLLRGKASQGRPHPLSMALRCEGQTLFGTTLGTTLWHNVRHGVGTTLGIALALSSPE